MGFCGTYLRDMKLERVVGGKAHVQTATEELLERDLIIVHEQVLVRERRHGDADLREVEEVLQHWGVLELHAVVDVVRQEEAARQVGLLAGFPAVRSKLESIESAVPERFVDELMDL